MVVRGCKGHGRGVKGGDCAGQCSDGARGTVAAPAQASGGAVGSSRGSGRGSGGSLDGWWGGVAAGAACTVPGTVAAKLAALPVHCCTVLLRQYIYARARHGVAGGGGVLVDAAPARRQPWTRQTVAAGSYGSGQAPSRLHHWHSRPAVRAAVTAWLWPWGCGRPDLMHTLRPLLTRSSPKLA